MKCPGCGGVLYLLANEEYAGSPAKAYCSNKNCNHVFDSIDEFIHASFSASRCKYCGDILTVTHDGQQTRFDCFNKNCKMFGGLGVKMRDNKRGSVLLDAHNTINGERQDVYGSPEDSFALIAKYWNVYLKSRPRDRAYPTGYKDAPLEKADVAMMMVLFKIAREANQHKPDNICDACGYLGIYEDMESAKEGSE